jgi:antitoxin (DNA-binding transcriptional repressor) of toxin-antitoxin stability system
MTITLEADQPQVRQVTIRELQQHAARVINELAAAEEIAEITSRGRVIAQLIPVSPAERAFAEMVARGEVTPAQSSRDISEIKPLPPRPDGRSLFDALMAMREEEPW